MSDFLLQVAAFGLIGAMFVVPIMISRLIAKRVGLIRWPLLLVLVPCTAAILPGAMLLLPKGNDPFSIVGMIMSALIAFLIGLWVSGVTYSFHNKNQ